MSNDPGSRLEASIDERSATIGIVGLGYVGLPLAHAFHTAGMSVIGFDVDQRKIDHLAACRPYLDHLGESLFTDLGSSERFAATVDMARMADCDVVIVCVPTPLGSHQEPDLSYVLDTAADIGASLRPGQLIVLESTTYPGTTRDELVPAMEAAATEPLVLGSDYFVAYSPEREDPGRSDQSTQSIPKLVGGLDERSGDLASRLYEVAIREVVRVDRAEVAEAAKLLENIFRSVNIALVNEMKMVLTELGVDVWDVIEAASTKPFGFMPFFPGPGLGGHCIPIDPFYLSWKAKEVGRAVQFIELAGVVNTTMPTWVVAQLADALNDDERSLRGSRVLVMGLAYKSNVSDTRESPSFEIIELLRDKGSIVDYHDPWVPEAPQVRRHDLGLCSVDLDPETIASYDAVVIVTAHDSVDYGLLADHARLIVDTRNAMSGHGDRVKHRLVKA